MSLVCRLPDWKCWNIVSPPGSVKATRCSTPVCHARTARSSDFCTKFTRSVFPYEYKRRRRGCMSRHDVSRVTGEAAICGHLSCRLASLRPSPNPRLSLPENLHMLTFEFRLLQFLSLCFCTIAVQFCGVLDSPTAEAIWRGEEETHGLASQVILTLGSYAETREERLTARHLGAFEYEDVTYVASVIGETAPSVGLVNGRLQACSGSEPCVSTSSFRSPSRYMPPWTYLGSQEEAYKELRSAVTRSGAMVELEDGEKYMYATYAGSEDPLDVDDIEFVFTRGGVLCFRSVSRKVMPDPPFCWWRGCINGPRNRGRLEALRDDLGWVPLETDEDKEWVPLLLH